MTVELINKEELKDFYKNWGEFAVKCYDTPKERAVGVGKHCMRNGHYSGNRCEYFKFEISGISRACSMQLNRHEIGVVKNQQSQRFTSLENAEFVIPPHIKKNKRALELYLRSLEDSKKVYSDIQQLLMIDKRTREQANEDARYILPESTYTSGVWAFTFEGLTHFMHKRLCSRSQWEIQQLARAMRKEVLEIMPELKDQLVPHCKYLTWCPEGKSCCGMMPTKEEKKNEQ